MPIITLTTDFGHYDAYVAAMKGRLLSLCPTVQLVDITHEVPQGNIMRGALVVRDVAPYFPRGAVHLVVIDPGVGTERRGLILENDWLKAVGPDNGVLSLLWEGGVASRFYEIDEETVAHGSVSSTFHGRDVFAPAAALLASGVPARDLGHPLVDPVVLELPAPSRELGGLQGEVLYHDTFGNLVTNIRRDQLPGPADHLMVEVGGHRIYGLVRTYMQAGGAAPVALIGSTGLLEIAIPGGSAYEALGVGFGARVGLQVVSRTGGQY